MQMRTVLCSPRAIPISNHLSKRFRLTNIFLNLPVWVIMFKTKMGASQ